MKSKDFVKTNWAKLVLIIRFLKQNDAEMAKKVGKADKDANFTWIDEDTALLTRVLIDFKVAKGLDLETVKTK